MSFKKTGLATRGIVLAIFFLFSTVWRMMAGLQLVSTTDGSTPVSVSANGDSYLPSLSSDGRYVLFASTANNLVLTNNNGWIPGQTPHKLNLYLRDRVNLTTTLVSANLNGDGANWDCVADGISTNSQYVLFESEASDLVSGDGNKMNDIFVRDIVNGTTTLVSVNTNGVSGNRASRNAVMTPDGRFVAFVSDATDLVTNDINGISDVFVRDLLAGTTTVASFGALAIHPPFPSLGSDSPAITPDGRFVAFMSLATNLVSGVSVGGEVYVRDLIAGTTLWASTNARSLFQAVSGTTNTVSCNQAISADGKFVVFEVCKNGVVQPNSSGLLLRYNTQTHTTETIYTNAYNAYVPTGLPFADIKTLDMTADGNFIAFVANDTRITGNTLIYLRDMLARTNILVTVNQTNGTPTQVTSDTPIVDATGRYVAFSCTATNLATNATASPFATYLYVRDMQMGVTQLIDSNTNGLGVGTMIDSAMSVDGRFAAFDGANSRMVPNDNNYGNDVFVRDLSAGTTELISARQPDLPLPLPNNFSRLFSTSVSTNGRYIAFASEADNLTANDTNGCRDIFVHDLWLQTNTLVSVGINGFAAIGSRLENSAVSTEPSISGDGRYVAFSSWATNVVGHDANQSEDVFLRDLPAGTNYLISAAIDGGFGNGRSDMPLVSADGGLVLYHSWAQNLTTNFIAQATQNLFLRYVSMRTNYALTIGSVTSAAMTPDGHYVVYVGVAPGLSATNLYVWDAQAKARIYTNSSSSLANVAISQDGRWVAYVSGVTLFAFDLVGKTNYTVSPGPFDFRAGLQFSADDRFLVFVTKNQVTKADLNGTYDVYLHDFQTGKTGTNILVSKSFATTNAANRASFSPSLSPDGHWVAYESYASDLVPGDTNNAADLFLYDQTSGSTMLVSVNLAGVATGNGFSQTPVFSDDSSNLVFETFASNLPGAVGNTEGAILTMNLSASASSGTGSDGDGSTSQWEVQFLASPATGQNPMFSWPVVSGGTYKVQFKNNLSDPVWQDLNGNTTLVGNQGRATDFAPPIQRFYRVVSSN